MQARLAQLVERKALNLVVVGSSPTVGAFHVLLLRWKLEMERRSNVVVEGKRGNRQGQSLRGRRQCSLAVEHPLSKREVVGSNPAIGSLLIDVLRQNKKQ